MSKYYLMIDFNELLLVAFVYAVIKYGIKYILLGVK